MSTTLFQRALLGESLSVPPIWMMRQAGRYHQHYQARRQKYSFVEMCKNPKLAAEIAMGPIEDFDFDASIFFSDLLFTLEALGMPLTYEPGPKLGYFLNNRDIFKTFKKTSEAVAHMSFQAEALRCTRDQLPTDKSLIGFVGGPWTLFVYATEGTHKGHLEGSYAQIELFKEFCDHMVPLLKANIELQHQAGAEVVVVMDTAAGECAPHFFKNHLLKTLEELSKAQKPVAYYTKGGTADHYSLLNSTNFKGFGYDHRFDLPTLFKNNAQNFVQGNFNQHFLTLEPDLFKKEFDNWIAPLTKLSPQERKGWVCGVGHGLVPTTKEVNVRTFISEVRKLFKDT